MKIQELATPPSSPSDEQPQHSRQQKQGRKIVKRIDRKCYRTIQKHKETISKQNNKIRSLERKVMRLQKTCPNQQELIPASVEASPATKANKLLACGNAADIRKELVFSYALNAELKKKLKVNDKKRNEKSVVRNVVVGPILRKYRLLLKAQTNLALTERQR